MLWKWEYKKKLALDLKSCCHWKCDKSLTVIKTHFLLKRRSSEQQSGECDMMTDLSLRIRPALICSHHVYRCEEKAEQKQTTDTATVICFWSKNLTQRNYFRKSPTVIVLNLSDCWAWTLPLDSTPTQCREGTAFLDIKGSIPQWLMLAVEFRDFGSTNAIKRIFVSFLLFCPSLHFLSLLSSPSQELMCSLVMIFHCHFPPGSHFVCRWSWRGVEVRVR